jgi:periplasmic protein TonB
MIALRLPVAAGLGGLLTLAVFTVLGGLVSRPVEVAPVIQAHVIDFTRLLADTPVHTKKIEKAHREPPPVVPNTPHVGPGDHDVEVKWQHPAPPIQDPGLGAVGGHLRPDGDPVPLYRASPDYPRTALARGTEGWVQVQFSVAADGTVRDARVVASEPQHVFDQAALRAVARWRYNPMIENGRPVERIGLQTVFRFELANPPQ